MVETMGPTRRNRLAFNLWPAFIAGVVGGASMVVMRMLLQNAGIDLIFDPARLWGTMVLAQGTTAQVLGMLIHLVGSGGIAVIFAWFFDRLSASQHFWAWGLLGGVILWIIAGLFMGLVPFLHPEIPEQRPGPGVFLMHFGALEGIIFLIGHVLYGVVVGILYAAFHPAGGTQAIT
jgi:hypothetical protein